GSVRRRGLRFRYGNGAVEPPHKGRARTARTVRVAAAGTLFPGAHRKYEIDKTTSSRVVTYRRHEETWRWDDRDQGEADSRHRSELGDRGGVRSAVRERGGGSGPVGAAGRASGAAGGRAQHGAPGVPVAGGGGRTGPHGGQPGRR